MRSVRFLFFGFVILLLCDGRAGYFDMPDMPDIPMPSSFDSITTHISSALDGSHKTAVLTHFHRGGVYENLRAKLISLSLSDMEIDDILDNSSHIITTYLQFVHHANSKPVFLEFRSSDYEKRLILSRSSAVLFPGGNMKLRLRYSNRDRAFNKMDSRDPGEYLVMVKSIMGMIRKINTISRAMGKKQINLLGICLGFIGILFTDSNYRLRFFNVERKFLNDKIKFISARRNLLAILGKSKKDRELSSKTSVVAALFTARQKKLLRTRNITFFNHGKSILVKEFNKIKNLKKKYDVVATYTIPEGKGVAIIESKTEPIYGTQFHPERMSFETHQNFSQSFKDSERRINKQYSKLLNVDYDDLKPQKDYVINTTKIRKTGDYYYIDVPDVHKYGMITIVSKKRNIAKFAELISKQI